MPTTDHRRAVPIRAAGEQRRITPHDRNNSPKLWAHSYLPGYEKPQLEAALALIAREPEAHRPLHSAARVAYLRLSAHLDQL